MTKTIEAPAAPLTANDRCDKCGAAAKVRVLFASGELLFCGHHAHQYNFPVPKEDS